MDKIMKITAMLLAAALLVFSMCACSDSEDTSSLESRLSVSEIKTDIIGQWGRQGETMHYFNTDMTCIVGGMQGTYEIDDSSNLILTTMSGSKTTYEWAESSTDASTPNYWSMTADTLTVNGNTFTKISDEEFENYYETADEAE